MGKVWPIWKESFPVILGEVLPFMDLRKQVANTTHLTASSIPFDFPTPIKLYSPKHLTPPLLLSHIIGREQSRQAATQLIDIVGVDAWLNGQCVFLTSDFTRARQTAGSFVAFSPYRPISHTSSCLVPLVLPLHFISPHISFSPPHHCIPTRRSTATTEDFIPCPIPSHIARY